MEKFIIGESSTKKTKRMLEYAKENNSTVICKNVLSMQSKANAYGLYGIEFISYEEFYNGNADANKIAVDELGEFFKHRFGVELDAFTMTVE